MVRGLEPSIVGAGDAVRRHLFLLAPNNSGSTFVMGALARSRCALWLVREGQHIAGFHGPSSRGLGTRRLWAADEDRIAALRDPAAYRWDRNRNAWHFHARTESPDASVLMVASPPFLLVADQLARAFPDAAFLLMVRNPYAVAEGIIRRGVHAGPPPGGMDLPTAAAQHIVNTLRFQQANRALLGDRAISFTYEQMCADPTAVGARIARLVPPLHDLDLGRALPVKDEYDEPLGNMNARQIARLSRGDLGRIDAIFDAHRPLLAAFGYDRIDQ